MLFPSQRKLWVLVLVIGVFLAPSRSLAQGEAGQAFPAASPKPRNQADQEEITGPPTTGPILTSGALPMGRGNFAIQPYTYLSFLGGEFSPTWKARGAGKNQITLSNAFSLYYGITEKFWVSTFWSYYIQNWAYNIRNPEPGQGRTAQDGNYGPLSITFRYRFFAQEGRYPAVTGLFTLGVPSNRGDLVDVGTLPAQVSGTRNWGFTWGVNLHRYARPFILYLNLWYFMATSDKRPRGVDGGITLEKFNPWDQVKFNLAAEIPLRWEGGPWVLLLEMSKDLRGFVRLAHLDEALGAQAQGLARGLLRPRALLQRGQGSERLLVRAGLELRHGLPEREPRPPWRAPGPSPPLVQQGNDIIVPRLPVQGPRQPQHTLRSVRVGGGALDRLLEVLLRQRVEPVLQRRLALGQDRFRGLLLGAQRAPRAGQHKTRRDPYREDRL